MEQSSKQIKHGAIISYLALAINIGATLLYMPWMVSVIGKANYAMYTLANSFVNIFVIDFGLSASVSKFIAQFRAENDKDKEIAFVSTIAKIYIILDIIILGILFVLYFFIGSIYVGLTQEEIRTFRLLYLIVASYAVVSFPFLPLSGIMYAYEQLIQLKFCEMFQKIFTIILVCIALSYKAKVEFVVLANVVSALFTIVLKYIVIKKRTLLHIRLSLANMDMFKQVVGFTVWIAVQAFAQRFIFNLAPTILGIVSTSEDIAIFSPASSIESYFASVAAAINGFFIMRVTKYIISNEKEKLYQLNLKVGRFQLLLMGMIFVVFVSVGENFMCAWMGADFQDAWICAAWIMIPDILIFSEQVVNTAAIADNLVKHQTFGYVIMAVVCVAFSFPLSKIYGALGASIAITVAYSVLFVYNNIVYHKKLHLDMWKFIKECYGRLLLPVLGTGCAGYWICHSWIIINGWRGVIVKGAVTTAIYMTTIVFFLSKEEKIMIRGLFKRN